MDQPRIGRGKKERGGRAFCRSGIEVLVAVARGGERVLLLALVFGLGGKK